jgi:hypothetical protein
MPYPALSTDEDGLFDAARASALGLESVLRRARRDGTMVPVRRGVYQLGTRAVELTALEVHRTRAFAVDHQREAPVFAAQTAAVLHRLPFIGSPPEEIFVLAGGSSGRRRNGVIEIARRGDEAVVHLGGRLVTSVAETVVEVARRMPLRTALIMADAALAAPRYGDTQARCTMDELRDIVAGRSRFRGVRAVEAMLARCTTKAESPLESLSRLQIEEAGFPTPELQLPVLLPSRGTYAFLDFAWPAHGIWGEADGRRKYLGDADAKTAADLVIREKRREDQIRAATGWRCARWDWRDAWDGGRLRDILRQAGLPAARRMRST